MTKVKLLHAALHGPSFTAGIGKRGYASNADLIDWTETYHAHGWFQENPGYYHHFTATGKPVGGKDPDRRDAHGRLVGHDVTLSVHKQHTVVDHGYFWVCDELPGKQLKYHPERWGVWVVFETDAHKKRVLAVFTHPQPGLSPKAWGEYRRGMKRFEAEVNRLVEQFKPDLVVSGGDLQHGRTLGRLLGPARVFKRLGLAYRNAKIDWLAWSKSWRRAGGKTLDLRAWSGGKLDHVWLRQDVEQD